MNPIYCGLGKYGIRFLQKMSVQSGTVSRMVAVDVDEKRLEECGIPEYYTVKSGSDQDDGSNTDTEQKIQEHVKLLLKAYNKENMELQFRNIEQPLLSRFENAKDSLLANMEKRLEDTKTFIKNCITILESASPQTIFARGYSMVRDKNTQKIIRSPADTSAGNEIEIVPAKGIITAKVISLG